jgi:tetratricopeptide (TPR) repeat protein
MSGIQLQLKEESLLELTLVSIKANQLKEALERLETYIPLVPFGDNPVLVGYAGLISYVLWTREPSMLRYRRTAIEFLQSSLQINPYNSYFLKYFVKLMSTNDSDLEQLTSFLASRNISSNNYFLLKALYHTYKQLKKPMPTWTLISYQLCLTNPMIEVEILLELSDVVHQFGEHLTGLSLEKIVELLAIRIEHEKSNLLVWRHIVKYIPFLS